MLRGLIIRNSKKCNWNVTKSAVFTPELVRLGLFGLVSFELLLLFLGSLFCAQRGHQGSSHNIPGIDTRSFPRTRQTVSQVSHTHCLRGSIPRSAIPFIATAYSWREPAHKQYGKLNCLGGVLDDQTIAVDPKIIPLGSKVLIEGVGIKKAVDVGSAIKGQKIDIHFDSLDDMNAFGKRIIQVSILK